MVVCNKSPNKKSSIYNLKNTFQNLGRKSLMITVTSEQALMTNDTVFLRPMIINIIISL